MADSRRRSPRSSKGVPSKFLQDNYELGIHARPSGSNHPSTGDHKKPDKKEKGTAVATDSSIPLNLASAPKSAKRLPTTHASARKNDESPDPANDSLRGPTMPIQNSYAPDLISSSLETQVISSGPVPSLPSQLEGDEVFISANYFIDKTSGPLGKTPSAVTQLGNDADTIRDKLKPLSSGDERLIEPGPSQGLSTGSRQLLNPDSPNGSSFVAQESSRAELAFARLRDPTTQCKLCAAEFQSPHQLQFSRWLGWRLCRGCFDQYGTRSCCRRAPLSAPWRQNAEKRGYLMLRFIAPKQLSLNQAEPQAAHEAPTDYLSTDQAWDFTNTLNAMDWPSADIQDELLANGPWQHHPPAPQSSPSPSEARNEEMQNDDISSGNPLADYNQWKQNNPNPRVEEALQRHREYLDDVEGLSNQRIQNWNFGKYDIDTQDSGAKF